MMNLLRTGNIMIDTAVSMFIPILFSSFTFFLKILFPFIESILDNYFFVDDNSIVSLDYEVKLSFSLCLSVSLSPYLSLSDFFLSFTKTLGAI
jgi:hypothetical protein